MKTFDTDNLLLLGDTLPMADIVPPVESTLTSDPMQFAGEIAPLSTNPLMDFVADRMRSRDQRGVAGLLLMPKVVLAGSALILGATLSLYNLGDVKVSVHNHTELGVTRAQSEVNNIVVGGNDFCPVRFDDHALVNARFLMQQTVGASFHGIGGHVKLPPEIWGVDGDMTLTGPECIPKQTSIVVTSTPTIHEKDAQGKDKTTKAVYAKLRNNVAITFAMSEKDPIADTFTNNDNGPAKLINLTGAELDVFPYTGFLHPEATDDVHTLLHQVDLTVATNDAATKCGPLVMEAAKTYVQDLVEDEIYKELKGFGVERQNVHVDMSNLTTADYLAQDQASEDKLKAVEGLNYTSTVGTCSISKNASVEVIK